LLLLLLLLSLYASNQNDSSAARGLVPGSRGGSYNEGGCVGEVSAASERLQPPQLLRITDPLQNHLVVPA